MSDFLFQYREPLSGVASTTLMLMFLVAGPLIAPVSRPAETTSAPIELMLEVPEELKPAPAPEVTPPPVLPRPAIPHKLTPAVALSESMVGVRKAIAMPTVPTIPTDQLDAAPVAPDAVAPATQPVPVPAQLDQPVPEATSLPLLTKSGGNVDAEAAYVGKVRAHLQASKRYPTGREVSLQRPAGTSVIWFILRRNGELVGAGVDTSSGSMLLDNAALATVRRSMYPAYPDEAWPGKEQQRFTVELDFVPMN